MLPKSILLVMKASMSVSSELWSRYSSEPILLFSVDRSMIDGDIWWYMFMEGQITVKCDSEIVSVSTWANNSLVIQNKRFKVRMSKIFGDWQELGLFWIEFETILPHEILNSLEASSYLLSSINVSYSHSWGKQWPMVQGILLKARISRFAFFLKIQLSLLDLLCNACPCGVVMIAIGVLPNYWISPFCYFVTTWGSNEPPWLAAWLYDWLYDWDWFLSV